MPDPHLILGEYIPKPNSGGCVYNFYMGRVFICFFLAIAQQGENFGDAPFRKLRPSVPSDASPSGVFRCPLRKMRPSALSDATPFAKSALQRLPMLPPMTTC
jgi:hypothetical protein